MDSKGKGSRAFPRGLLAIAVAVPTIATIIIAMLVSVEGGEAEPAGGAAGPAADSSLVVAAETEAEDARIDASKAGPRPSSNEADTAGEDLRPAGGLPAPSTPPEDEMPPDPPRPATPVDGIMVVQVLDGRTVDLYDAPEGNIAATQGDETEFGSPSVFWVRRRTGRWFGVSSPEVPNSELAWIRADPRTLSAKFIRHSMVVDLSARTAHLFQGHRQIRSWPITVGAPGTETPTGRFAITDTLRGDLSPAYGCCALALSATQPKLPSDWSGGDRIAFHGTSGPLGIAASTGCIRSPDSVLKTLLEEVELGTPVVIRD